MQLISRLATTLKRDARRAWRAGAGFIAISRWTSAVVGIARRILLARILGAESIGHIAVINAVMSVVRLPAGAGTFPVVTKLVAENPGDLPAQRRVIGTSVRINAVTSLLAVGVLWGILTFFNVIRDPVAKRFLYIFAIFVPVIIFSGLLRCGVMGQRRMKTVGKLDMTATMVGFVIVVALATFWLLRGWFIGSLVSFVLELALFTWFIRPILSWKWDRDVALRIAKIGGLSFLSQLLSVLVLQVDTLTVSGMLEDPALTGIYNTAALAVAQLSLLPGAVLVVTFPFVAENRNNMPLLRERYRELRKKLLFMTAALAAVAWVLCPWFFPIFGAEFSASTAPFRVLVLGMIARSLYVLDNTYLEALGRTDVLFVVVTLSTALIIGLNVIMIPRYGLMGAAWATTISMFVGLLMREIVVQYFIFHKKAIR